MRAIATSSVLFSRRLLGVLALDPATFEDIEADTRAGMQSVVVVLGVTAAGGLAGMGLGFVGLAGFLTAAIMMLGAWLVWVSLIATLGTTILAEPVTRSSARELLRTLGFASAPGLLLAFAAMRSAAPLVFGVVAVWMVAAAVIAVRQALDYRSTARAIAVCSIGFALAAGISLLIGLALARPVS
jgi:4-hydroxybenzoate polyprenyltransferase